MHLEQLFHECRRERPSAQKAMYDLYARPMYALCRRYVKSEAAAEEVLHNGFLKFFSGLRKFEWQHDAGAVAWMKRIFVNECLMHLRSAHSFLQVAIDEAGDLPYSEESFDRFAAADIQMAILQLPVGYRTVFNLYVVEQYSHKEIAALLGISEGTSKSQLSKARVLLQQTLIRLNPEYAFRKTR